MADTLESKLQAIWRELLDRKSVAATDDFFDLGGDSGTAMAMLLQIEDDLGIFLEPDVLYENSEFGEFVRALGGLQADQKTEEL